MKEAPLGEQGLSQAPGLCPRLPTLDRGPSPAQDPGLPAGPSTPLFIHSTPPSCTTLCHSEFSCLLAVARAEPLGTRFTFSPSEVALGWIISPQVVSSLGGAVEGPPVASCQHRLGIYNTLCWALQCEMCDVIPLTLPSPRKVGLSCRHPSLAESEAQKGRVTCPRPHSW